MTVMDLNGLLFKRLCGYPGIKESLAEYRGNPAVFPLEVPPDQQQGWGGRTQYPRICYRFDMQVNQERSSAGVLRAAIYTAKDLHMMNKIEDLVRRCLKDVLMKPSGQAPFCVAWAASQDYQMGESGVMCREAAFDVLEYPDQTTTDPDPVMAVSTFIKELYPDSIVLGIDRAGDYVDSSDKPVFFCRLKDINSTTGHCMHSIAWFDCKVAVHLLYPDASKRLKMIAAINQRMAVEREVIMLDQSPMRLNELQVNNTADYLREGQLMVTGKYGCLRGGEKKHYLTDIGMGFTD